VARFLTIASVAKAVTDATIIHKFGFMVWDRDGESWKGTLIDPDGEKLARCKLADRSPTCKKR